MLLVPRREVLHQLREIVDPHVQRILFVGELMLFRVPLRRERGWFRTIVLMLSLLSGRLTVRSPS